MDAMLIERLQGAGITMDDLAGILLDNMSPDNVLKMFRDRGVELTAEEAEELTASLQKSKATVELGDDDLDDVVGGWQWIKDAADAADKVILDARLAACTIAPLVNGCPEMLEKYKKSGF